MKLQLSGPVEYGIAIGSNTYDINGQITSLTNWNYICTSKYTPKLEVCIICLGEKL